MKIKADPVKVGRWGARIIRILCWTLRFEIEDHALAFDPANTQPYIWAFWHNRMIVVPVAWRRYAPHRHGAVLTSASRDGSYVAGVMAGFGCRTIRGSSSRRGAAALRELTDVLKGGEDIAIAPDGPRGPIYTISSGVVFLARYSGIPIMPVRVEYSSAWRLKSWDKFMIPKPFCKVRVIFDTPIHIAPDAEVESACAMVANAMAPENQ